MASVLAVLTLEDTVAPILDYARKLLAHVLCIQESLVQVEIEYGPNARVVPHFSVDAENIEVSPDEIKKYMRQVWVRIRPMLSLMIARTREQWHEFG